VLMGKLLHDSKSPRIFGNDSVIVEGLECHCVATSNQLSIVDVVLVHNRCRSFA
jgi:hypothetical protein